MVGRGAAASVFLSVGFSVGNNLTRRNSEVLEGFSKKSDVPALDRARGIVRALAARHPNGTPFKVWGPSVARRLGISARRVRGYLYGEVQRVDADELARMERAVACSDQIAASRHEAIAAHTLAVDPEFFRDDIARHRDAARLLRGK